MARGLRNTVAAVAIWGTNAERNAAAVAELSGDSPDAPVAAFGVDVSDEDAVNDKVSIGDGRPLTPALAKQESMAPKVRRRRSPACA